MSINNILKTHAGHRTGGSNGMAQTPYDEGQKALREQNWSGAAEQFEKAIKADKRHCRRLHVLARPCALQGRPQERSGTPGTHSGTQVPR